MLWTQVEQKLIDLLKRDSTWDIMTKFIRAVFPMLIVLRLADQKEPVMDKLFFYVRRMDKTLEKSKTMLDEVEELMNRLPLRVVNEICVNGINDEEVYVETEDNETASTTDDNTLDGTDKKSLGQKIVDLWCKRREKLVTDFSITGWLLSPIPEIFNDSCHNMTGEYREAVERLLK
jgi:hypothetical protein